ncbi:hypothetical protein [Pannonibacter sp. SL95]|uniref:hypothetical protein n=1 Tax=Pannonibacter sp. SL95 TaxID=2995153 RepID=UPI002274C0D4|nr:hypothetical protein [Pannonibacter sp. SL95]MCY1708196.1 hypothetical protein [Pannonibacter sp. SL95]
MALANDCLQSFPQLQKLLARSQYCEAIAADNLMKNDIQPLDWYNFRVTSRFIVYPSLKARKACRHLLDRLSYAVRAVSLCIRSFSLVMGPRVAENNANQRISGTRRVSLCETNSPASWTRTR